MRNRALLAAVGAALLSACAAQAPAPAERAAPEASVAAVQSEAHRLDALVEAYFEDQLQLRPLLATSIGDKRYNDQYPVSISPEFRAKAEQLERDYLARVQQVDPSRLSGQDLLTVASFEQKVAVQVAGLGCGWVPEPFARPWLASGRLVAKQVEQPRPPAALRYAWRRAARGKALAWWLERLEVARVRERLLEGPVSAHDAKPAAS